MGTHSIWNKKIRRINKLFESGLQRISRDVDWYLYGGKKHFYRYAANIIKAHKWCFIVGCNNSGTTLLQDMLGGLPQISTLPHEGQDHTNVLKRAYKRNYERVWTEYLDELKLEPGQDGNIVPRLMHDWMRELKLPIQEIIVEKTTANAVRMAWLQENFPRSCFIGMVRNGFAVTEGIRRKGNKSVVRGARHWNKVNQLMLAEAANVDNFMLLKYEDLANKDPIVFQAIAKHIGLKENCFENLLLHPKSVRNFNSESISRLSSDDIKIIQAEAGEMLSHYGYSA